MFDTQFRSHISVDAMPIFVFLLININNARLHIYGRAVDHKKNIF